MKTDIKTGSVDTMQPVGAASLEARLVALFTSESKNEHKRQQLVEHLKHFLDSSRQQAGARLNETGRGTECARALSKTMDVMICQLYSAATRLVPSSDSSQTNNICIIAVGGYGRDTLAPHSDIDLLCLLPDKPAPSQTQVIEFMLYALWDMGLKVGQATRSIEECIELSLTDNTICTSILEARYICGAKPLYECLLERFDSDIQKKHAKSFIAQKLHERDERHTKAGESRYLVEPDIKDGKGGLRDLHTLFWMAKFYYRVRKISDLAQEGVFSKTELRTFRKSEDFLWAVRCHLHFESGRAQEKLYFDIQPQIASKLGYLDHPGLSAVERFMKHYFLTAKKTGELTRILCAALEEVQAKHVRGLDRIFLTFSNRRRALSGTRDFVIENHRITAANEDIFKSDPVNLIRLYWYVDKHGLGLNPSTLRLVTQSLRLITKQVRNNEQANRLFLDILTSANNPERVLRRMNESGVLGRFIPDFGKIVAMMQFSMYHRYTVDEHLLRCMGILAKIESGDLVEDHPLAGSILPTLSQYRNVLYVAVFLHDIAKGRPQDHSIEGARLARKLCPRLGLAEHETELVAWLIKHHLDMSMTAQSRDLSDRKTIEDFSSVVQTVDRLKLLLVLTVCDIRGVGPGVWNGWKGQLLRTLYAEAELLLSGGFLAASRTQRAKIARQTLYDQLDIWPHEERHDLIKRHYDAYMLAVPLEKQLLHANFIRQADKCGQQIASDVTIHDFEAIVELTLYTPDNPRLLSIIATACASSGANIVSAQVFTTADGCALDTILLNREFESRDDEQRRAQEICQKIEHMLQGRSSRRREDNRLQVRRVAKAFQIKPRIEIRNEWSHKFSVVEVEGLDRSGLLADLTTRLSALSLDIASAQITTFGEKIIDTFYVTDLTGKKIEDKRRQNRIRRELAAVLEAGSSS